MTEPAQAAVPATTVPPEHEMLRRLVDILTYGLQSVTEQAGARYYLVHVLYDGNPAIEQFESIDAVRDRLSAIRAAMLAEATTPRPHWLYVFHGKQLNLQTGAIWQLGDGQRVINISPVASPSNPASGLASIGLPDTVVQQSQREDDAAAAAARDAQDAQNNTDGADNSAQNSNEAAY